MNSNVGARTYLVIVRLNGFTVIARAKETGSSLEDGGGQRTESLCFHISNALIQGLYFRGKFVQLDQVQASLYFLSAFSLNNLVLLIATMGLATLPSASEGVLCVILVNTAVSISIVRHILRAFLFIIGVRLESSFTSSETFDENPESYNLAPPDSYMEEFRIRTPAIRFDSVCSAEEDETFEHDCSICLCGFEPDSEINRLSCGHVFHKVCFDQWVDYWNTTCPLCRTPIKLPEDQLFNPVCGDWQL
ncbi:hypothetical protein Nepgr_014400 [Nepenthes gracilis]|uniref:RING-type domain-containing protein n=1 Tax=Nepenthes gracilis TaxID=150966 RepID=A0AAD3SKS9_NEPGR|nr:hypothetical protein Nepgr_014400 [Nepenthes gracilis]